MKLSTIESRALPLALMLALAGAGCSAETSEDLGDNDFPLSDVDPLYEDAPADNGRGLPRDDSKADEVIPPQFDLMDYATPVRSQGRRGTCTIFASLGLMEALYNREGSFPDPDFSEQFLQWSTKFEVGAFPNTSGSNASYNLQAINRFGVVEEDVWPYESNQWGVDDDPACTGDDQPTRCYTNGEPTEQMLTAPRFTLPRGRWINPRPRSLQGHMLSTRTPVVVGGSFFYQSWNHGSSNLPTNAEYRRQGYVLAPNEADIEDSSGERRAGHGFVLFGWDDDLEVQRVDGEGNLMVDEEGEPVMERGFFLFKNSWGTGRWGSANPMGDGYGWISYRYVEEHLTAYTAGLPDVVVPEICNDDIDNDRDGAIDCDDAACAGEHACMDPGDDLLNDTPVEIPDDDERGVTSSITVTEPGLLSSMAVMVDVSHTYIGDLSIRLIREEDGTEVVLHDRSGGSTDDLLETFDVAAFNNSDARGTYTLHIADHAGADVGTLNQWSLELTRCMSDCDTTPSEHTYEDDAATPIEDLSTVQRTLSATDAGEVTSMSVTVDIEHTSTLDLTIRFGRAGGREFVLLTEDYSGAERLQRTFEVPGVIGEELQGEWTLTVVDGLAGDSGTLHSWSVTAATR